MKEENRPKVGVGVMVFKDGKVLLGKRKASHGIGEYSFPGGHLEYMESFKKCVERETQEETGIDIKNIQFQFLFNQQEYAPKHFVMIGFTAEWKSGELQRMEPDKFEDWNWYDMNNLPLPLFEPTKKLIQSYLTKEKYRDAE